MSRRAPSSATSSLELLLDTICNMFGGVLFISLLVVILLNTTSEAIVETPPSEMSRVELIEADIEREKLTAQLERLKQSVDQVDAVTGSIASVDVIRLAKQVKLRRSAHSQLVIDRSQTVGQLTAAQNRINQHSRLLRDRKAKLEAAKTRLAALQRKLRDAVDQRSRTAEIPKATKTSLTGQTYFLKGGNLYGSRQSDPGDFNVTTSGNTTYVDVNPSGGIRVDPALSNVRQLQGKFSGIDSTSHFVRIFVWPDSFEHFEAVRDAMDPLDLKYELIPCEATTRITLGGTARPSYVQ